MMAAAGELQALVYAHLRQGRLQEATRLCGHYLDLYPPDAGILRVMTLVCESLGENDAAHAAAHLWAQTCPADATAHYHLALAELQRGRSAEARSRLALALRLTGGTPELVAHCLRIIADLDAIQLRQIRALAEVDAAFALTLQRDPEAALADRGFSLSQIALSSLETLAARQLGHRGYLVGHA